MCTCKSSVVLCRNGWSMYFTVLNSALSIRQHRLVFENEEHLEILITVNVYYYCVGILNLFNILLKIACFKVLESLGKIVKAPVGFNSWLADQ